MAVTTIAFGDAKAQKKWSGLLFLDTAKKSYFDKKFVGEGENKVIQRLTDLEQAAGDTITFDLSIQLRQKPTTGDKRAEGKEESLRFASDQVIIDQIRHPVSAGGKMTRKRTNHDTRAICKAKLGDYWARYLDEMRFIYLSGARGINQDFIEETTWAGHAGNAIQAPDSLHLLYGGTATAKANLTANDKMSRLLIERAAVRAEMMSAEDPTSVPMQPVMIDGEAHFVCVMSTYQEHDLRTNDTPGWLDIQKAAITAEGRANPIFKGGLGMVKNVVLHSHKNAIRFADYGAGNNVQAARALFMGAQAGVIAYGSERDKQRYTWEEELKDYGNEPTVCAGLIVGVKKTRFNGKDFGVIALDTAAQTPG